MTTLAPQKLGQRLHGRFSAIRDACNRQLDRVALIRPGFAGQKARARRRIRALGPEVASAVRVDGWDGYVVLRGELPSRELVQKVEAAVAAGHSPRKIHNFLRVSA